MLDLERGGHPFTFGNSPSGRSARMSRKARCPAKQLPARIDLRADRLRHAEDDAAGKRAPHAAEPADDDGLEAEDQPRRSDRRIEIGAHGDEHAGDRNDRQRQRHGEREDVPVVEAHQLGDGLVIRGRPKGAAERSAIEQKLQRADHGHSDDELQQRKHADPDARCQRKARDFDRAGAQPPAVGGEQLKQRVLNDHGEPERH